MTLLLGYDLGSSSIKASLLDAQNGRALASAASPSTEMAIDAPRPGRAEQPPQLWWDHLIRATRSLAARPGFHLDGVEAIGISYQMHGLVVVDADLRVLRPAIIWCDSRCSEIAERAASSIGRRTCLERLLNFPGNFTASKLRWIRENEPEIYKKIHKAMLPGDYIAMKMTGLPRTTPSGLSEAILWDYQESNVAWLVLDEYDISPALIPEVVPTFSAQGRLTGKAATELGLPPGIKVTYRAGDQPNNALALNVLLPGEVAATAGTSGVVYGVADRPVFDEHSRVNTFLHVNHTTRDPRCGVLLCVNGTGIANGWIKRLLQSAASGVMTYDHMNTLACRAPAGAEGLCFLPFGNGAERTLENREIGASLHGLDYNRHGPEHLLRAVQEGIVFALNYGLGIMTQMGLEVQTVRAGHTNMFLSPLFQQAFATVTATQVELFETDGAQGAARGAGLGAGLYPSPVEALSGLQTVTQIEPDPRWREAYSAAYARWLERLETTGALHGTAILRCE